MVQEKVGGPNPIDVYAGGQVMKRRLELGFTQSDLAKTLGVTFQQVQKYEKGANRISASRLWDIARVLEVELSYFFPHGERAPTGVEDPGEHPLAREARRLKPAQQKLVLDLIAALAASTTRADETLAA